VFAASILPILSSGGMPSAVGPPVPASALGKELRQALPPTLIDALDRISDQIAVEVFDPLLCAVSVDQAAKAFECVFPKFRDYYVSSLLILWGFLQEDPQRFAALTMRSFEQSETLIRASGPHWIGQDATLNALHALATITRVAKAATRVFDRKAATDTSCDAAALEAWANSIIGFAMAFSAVLAALTALANGRETSARLENAEAFAHWSKNYAVCAYHLTKALGLLKLRPPTTPVGSSDNEDELLAESGLDSYAEALVEDDQP
jgi:hypothetical protein